MFAYYLQLGLRSLRRNPVLTALMVLAIGFGVAASTTTYAVLRAMSGDPIPWKSSRLFVPQIDPWGPRGRAPSGQLPADFTYTDAMALMRQIHLARQTALYPVAPTVYPNDPAQKAQATLGHAVYATFFAMLDVPFRYGAAWSAEDDARRSRVVVIGRELNRQLFADADSVGQEIRLDGQSYRIIGVLDAWHPRPKFYDVANDNAFGGADQIFLPFTTAIDRQMATRGGFGCGSKLPDPGFAGVLASDCVWIAFMVELDGTAQVAAYRQALDDYARAQQASGRFGWPPSNRLYDLPAWMQLQQVVPSEVKISLVVAACLLLVCMVNGIGLMLAKFLRRSGEIGVRRALGASRRAIAAQYGVEAAAIGLAGGAWGLLLTGFGVWWMHALLPRQVALLVHVDLGLLGLTLSLAVAATVVAGLYPIFRAAQVRPALQLKIG